MKKYIKIVLFIFLTLGILTACGDENLQDDDVVVDVNIPDIDDDVIIDENPPDGESNDIDVDQDEDEDFEMDTDIENQEPQFDKNTAIGKDKLETIALEVLEGRWGQGSAIKSQLEAAGYNFTEIDNEVKRIERVLFL